MGTVIPPFVIISLVSVFYDAFRTNYVISQLLEGMQAGVGAVIASVVYDMAAGVVKEKRPASLAILAGAFAAACVLEANVVLVILACGLLGVVRTLWNRRKGK